MKFLSLSIFLVFSFSLYSQTIDLTDAEKKWVKEHKEIYFGYDPNWPPYEFYQDGKYTGIAGDFVHRIGKKLGIKFVPIKNITWDRSYKLLLDEGLSMAPAVAVTEGRQKELIYSAPYIKLPAVIATKKEDKHLNHLNKLHYKRISIPRGYMQQEYLEINHPQIKLTLRNNFAECLQDVSSGRSVATVGSLGSISYFIKENGFSNIVVTAHTGMDSIDVAFAFPKSQDTLRNLINKALKTIGGHERSKIYSKWITINLNAEYDYTTMWRYIIFIGAIVIIIIFSFYFWNKLLRREIKQRKQIEHELSRTLLEVNKQNENKTVLLQEIHHRVKNNLQIIISLLRLQGNTHTNQDVKDALQEAIERINSISMVHEHIYKNPNLVEIDLKSYISNLGEELKRIFIDSKEIKIDVKCHDTKLEIKPMIPLALILNELYTNSFKYAFKNKTNGHISIELFIEDEVLHLLYNDDGEWFNNSYTRNFGTYLIDIFTDQLNGHYVRNVEPSCAYSFSFKDF